MAYKIISTCTACSACLPVCPIDAIAAGDPLYVIDQEACCDFEDCLAVCPVDAIVPSDAPTTGGASKMKTQALPGPTEKSAPAGQSV